MAFRASSQISANALAEIKSGAIRAQALAIQTRDTMAAGNVNAHYVLNLLSQCKTLIDRWSVLSSTPGIAAYAQSQENDVTYDVVTEFTNMRNALIAVRDNIVNTMPTATAPAGVVGNIAVYALTADGSQTTMSFTPAQTATLQSNLTAFIATVT